jgi:hypothetical protein
VGKNPVFQEKDMTDWVFGFSFLFLGFSSFFPGFLGFSKSLYFRHIKVRKSIVGRTSLLNV